MVSPSNTLITNLVNAIKNLINGKLDKTITDSGDYDWELFKDCENGQYEIIEGLLGVYLDEGIVHYARGFGIASELATQDDVSSHNHTGWTEVTCAPGKLYVNEDLRLAQWKSNGTLTASIGSSNVNKLVTASAWTGFSSTYAPPGTLRIRASTTEQFFVVIATDGSFGVTCTTSGNGKEFNGSVMWHY